MRHGRRNAECDRRGCDPNPVSQFPTHVPLLLIIRWNGSGIVENE
jgi:hypothetical protein